MDNIICNWIDRQTDKQTGRQTDRHALLPVLAPQFGHADPPPLGLAPQQRGHPHHQPAPELLRVLIRAHARHREVLHRLQDRGGVATGLKLVQHLVVGDLERLSSGKRADHLGEGEEWRLTGSTPSTARGRR